MAKKNERSQGISKKNMMMNDGNLVPPDGKYGWIIVFSYALANVSAL